MNFVNLHGEGGFWGLGGVGGGDGVGGCVVLCWV